MPTKIKFTAETRDGEMVAIRNRNTRDGFFNKQDFEFQLTMFGKNGVYSEAGKIYYPPISIVRIHVKEVEVNSVKAKQNLPIARTPTSNSV